MSRLLADLLHALLVVTQTCQKFDGASELIRSTLLLRRYFAELGNRCREPIAYLDSVYDTTPLEPPTAAYEFYDREPKLDEDIRYLDTLLHRIASELGQFSQVS